jgi:NADH:ubiquinone oxidoreductase subunit 6 (subunit J)
MKAIKEFFKKNSRKVLIIFIIIVFILLLSILLIIYLGSQRTDRGPWPRVQADLTQIRSVAEMIYSDENSYESLNY